MTDKTPNPASVIIAPWTYCTYNCRFCSRRLHERKKDWWSFEKVTDGLKDLWKDAQRANIGGCGEIGQVPYFYELLDYLREQNVRAQFCSNGYFLDVPRIRQGLIELVTISLHSVDEPTYNSLTGTKGFLPRVLDNIRQLAEQPRDYKLCLMAVTTELNVRQAPAFAQFAKDVGADAVRFTPLVEPVAIGLPDGYDDDLVLKETPENMDEPRRARRVFAGVQEVPLTTAERPAVVGHRMKTCAAPFGSTTINRRGDVVPCCCIARVVLGNVFETPWEEIWNGQKYQEFRESMKNGTNVACLQHCKKWG